MKNVNVLMYFYDLVHFGAQVIKTLTKDVLISRIKPYRDCMIDNTFINMSNYICQNLLLYNRPLQLEFFYCRVLIICSKNTKYLGVIFDYLLTLRLHVENLDKKSQRRLAII